MTFRSCALLLALGFAPSARAAVEPAVSTSAPSGFDLERVRRKAAPLALALDLAFGPEAWARVKISTEGAVADLDALIHKGHYKLELIELVLLSLRGGETLKALVEKRGKGATFKSLATDKALDYDRLYESALAIEELVDREYLPRFPERRRQGRDLP